MLISSSAKDVEEKKFIKYEPINSRSEILEEIKNVLIYDKNDDKDCISIYDVVQVLKKLYYDYNSVKMKYKDFFRRIITEKYDIYSSLIIYDFDYVNNELKIGFTRDISKCDYKEIYFSKENEDLYITKSESEYGEELLNILCCYLSKLYDELIKFNDYKDDSQGKYNIKSVNSKFNIDINNCGVRVFVESLNKTFENGFSLYSPSYNNKYSLKCNSGLVNEAINGKEQEIFKRIFVRIEDCPQWSQTVLHEIRENQLSEEEKIEKEKQKRLELKRKILSFFKK